MIENKNILLCLNQLEIGGIETAVYNQAITLKEKGFNIYVLAKTGVYSQRLTEKGINCIPFEFKIDPFNYDLKSINKVRDVLKQNNIGQVYIHQFDCITSVFPACMIENIPYIAYLHNGVKATYDFFIKERYDYNYAIFKLYFEMAYKIIAITEMVKNENIEKFNISENKFIVLKNSINFDEIKLHSKEQDITTIRKFLLISRLSHEKQISIKNGIEMFRKYHLKYPDATLTIVGDGNQEEEIKKQIEDISECVNMVGKTNNVLKYIKDCDIVIGLGRCILEAISMKRIAVISGYSEIKDIITPENIENFLRENFSGRDAESVTFDEIVNKIENLNKEKIKQITTLNYDFAYKNLNLKNNIYVIEEYENINFNLDNKLLFEILQLAGNEVIKAYNYSDKVYKECKEAQSFFEQQIKNQEEEIKKLKLIFEKDIKSKKNNVKMLIKKIIKKNHKLSRFI